MNRNMSGLIADTRASALKPHLSPRLHGQVAALRARHGDRWWWGAQAAGIVPGTKPTRNATLNALVRAGVLTRQRFGTGEAFLYRVREVPVQDGA